MCCVSVISIRKAGNNNSCECDDWRGCACENTKQAIHDMLVALYVEWLTSESFGQVDLTEVVKSASSVILHVPGESNYIYLGFLP